MSPVASNLDSYLPSADRQITRPVRPQTVEKLMRGKHVVVGDCGLSGEFFAVSFRPFTRIVATQSLRRRSGANDCNAERTTATAASDPHDKHSRFFPDQLNALGSESVRTISATFLLEVFLNSVETSTIQTAHRRPSILGSARCAERFFTPTDTMPFVKDHLVSAKGLYLNVVLGQVVIPRKSWIQQEKHDGAY
jgi:hypothetical protein